MPKLNNAAHSFTLAAVLAAAPVAADDDDDTDELPIPQDLFRTELVMPQEPGEVEIGFGLDYLRPNGDGDAWVAPVGLEIGIAEGLQFELSWDAYIVSNLGPERREGTGDFEAGLQYSWLDLGMPGLHAALGGEIRVRQAHEGLLEAADDADGWNLDAFDDAAGHDDDDDDDLDADADADDGGEEAAWEVYATIARDLLPGSRAQVMLQAGIEHEEGRELGFANLAGYAPIAGALFASLEYSWSAEAEGRYLTPGLTLATDRGWFFGVGVAFGLTDDADDLQVLGRISYEWE